MLGPTMRSSEPNTIGPSAASRSRPAGPRAGRNPGPNGGVSRDGNGSGYGHQEAQALPQASATASAPQALTSTSSTSGRASSIARRRSPASCSARRQNTRMARFWAPSGVRAR
jgi:hypothetical protein